MRVPPLISGLADPPSPDRSYPLHSRPQMRLLPRLIFASLILARPAGAQARLVFDNDLFAPRPLDRKAPDWEYTAGTRFSWTSPRTEWWAAHLGVGAPADSARERPVLRTVWEMGQEIYTPRRDAELPLPGERPYAGWLYGSVRAEAVSGARTRALTLQLGVTGPPSLAAPVQTELHRLAGFTIPLGWEHQLAFEPGIVARYGESWRLATPAAEAPVELAPEWEVALGNVHTGARAGLRARAGTAGLRRGRDGVYLSAAVHEEWVARNLFLDGNTFREGPRVQKRPFVPQAELGAGAHLGQIGIAYRVTFRGREYVTAQKPHAWGSIALEVHPRWSDAGR
jgi:lipid A 3-O-deacylase